MTKKDATQRTWAPKQMLPYILIVGGIIGFLAALILTIEKIELIKNPAFQPSCNINPLLSCGSVMKTPQAEVFGFPNSLIGIAGFAIVATIGMALLAGAQFKRWFWLWLQSGAIFAIGFITWLQFQSIYVIKALCPYCMVVWIVTIPIFWYTTLYILREKYIPIPERLKVFVNFLQRHHGDVLIAWYLVIVGLILAQFWYYWSKLL